MGLLLLMGGSSFSPASLFANGEQGGWYDPSDFTTLFQNSNGTTAVAAPGDPVGYIADKSGRGNHRTQSTSGSRPLLARLPDGIRRNLFTYSEDLSNAIWGKTSVTVTGTDTIVLSAGSAGKYVSQTITGTAPSTISFEAKEGAHRYIQVVSSSDSQHFVNIDLQTGTIGTTGSKAEGALIESLSDSWKKYRVTITNTGFSSIRFYAVDSSSAVYGASTSATTSWQMRKVQLETGSSANNYQKVVTAADITEDGKPDRWCLLYDRTGTWFHQTGNVAFSTDKVTVFSAVRKVSDAARQTVLELTASAASNNGAFHLTAPNAASDTFAFESKGTSLTDAVATGIAAPATRILTGIGNIAGDTATLRVNGVQANTDAGDQGTGNYSTAALYFGARGGSTLPFGGYEFGTIVRGAETPAATIQQVERWLAAKAGVTL